MALSTNPCITVKTATINQKGVEREEEVVLTVPKALCLLFSFDLRSRDCKTDEERGSLSVTEWHQNGFDVRTCIFNGSEEDMETLSEARDLFCYSNNWKETYSVSVIERMFRTHDQQVNGYPLYNRIAGQSHRSLEGSESRPEKIWLICMYACGVADPKDHDYVIKILKATGHWTLYGFKHEDEILASLLECRLEDPTFSIKYIAEIYGVA